MCTESVLCLRTTYNRVLCYSSKVQRGHIASACSISEKPIGTARELMTGLIIYFEPITSIIYLIAYHCPTLTLVGEGVIPTLPTLFFLFPPFPQFFHFPTKLHQAVGGVCNAMGDIESCRITRDFPLNQ